MNIPWAVITQLSKWIMRIYFETSLCPAQIDSQSNIIFLFMAMLFINLWWQEGLLVYMSSASVKRTFFVFPRKAFKIHPTAMAAQLIETLCPHELLHHRIFTRSRPSFRLKPPARSWKTRSIFKIIICDFASPKLAKDVACRGGKIPIMKIYHCKSLPDLLIETCRSMGPRTKLKAHKEDS